MRYKKTFDLWLELKRPKTIDASEVIRAWHLGSKSYIQKYFTFCYSVMKLMGLWSDMNLIGVDWVMDKLDYVFAITATD